MADLSEVKRLNIAVYLITRTLWPIDVKFYGIVDMGKKMSPIDL